MRFLKTFVHMTHDGERWFSVEEEAREAFETPSEGLKQALQQENNYNMGGIECSAFTLESKDCYTISSSNDCSRPSIQNHC